MNQSEDETLERLDRLEFQLQRVEKMVRQIRSIFIWMAIISVAVILLPMIGLVIVIPSFLDTFNQISAMGF